MFALISLLVASALAADASTVTVDAETIEFLEGGNDSYTVATTTEVTVVTKEDTHDVTTEQVCEVSKGYLTCEGVSYTATWSSEFSYEVSPEGQSGSVHDAYLDDDEALTYTVVFAHQPGVEPTPNMSYCGTLARELGELRAHIVAASNEYGDCLKGLNGGIQLPGSMLQADSWDQPLAQGGESSGNCEDETDALSDWIDQYSDTLDAWERADCDNGNSPGWD